MHLTPSCKVNKSFVYFTARRYPIHIEDRGDIVCLTWLSNTAVSVRIVIGQSAAEIEEALNTFLGDRPRDTQPKPSTAPKWKQQPRGGPPTQQAQA
jgi:hypothetical protein